MPIGASRTRDHIAFDREKYPKQLLKLLIIQRFLVLKTKLD